MSKNSERLIKDTHYITSNFGAVRTYTNTQGQKIKDVHSGTDYGTNRIKVNCYAFADYQVVTNTTNSSAGNYVILEYIYPNNIKYRGLYAHLDKKSDLVVGSKGKQGDLVGVVGMTGNVTGIHLHYGHYNMQTKKYEDFEKFTEPKEEEKPVKLKFNIGDAVKIIGKGNGSSDGKSNTAYGLGMERVVLNQYPDKPFPNQIGNKYGTTGFYKDDALEGKVVVENIKIGDTVVVNGYGSSSSNGVGHITRKYIDQKMKVIAIYNNAKYPFALNQYNKGIAGKFSDVSAWFKKDDCKKI